RGLNMFPTMVAAVVASVDALSGDYRIVLDQPPPHDVLPVRAELASGAQGDDALVQQIEGLFKKKLGATVKVELVPFGTFPRTEGKTRRVIRTYP
ncbi:MAG: hypothetical protein KDJ51_12795, partial [Nitratireductor sp.]|nr:hypothetical protein [Nitratireductor sp.]